MTYIHYTHLQGRCLLIFLFLFLFFTLHTTVHFKTREIPRHPDVIFKANFRHHFYIISHINSENRDQRDERSS